MKDLSISLSLIKVSPINTPLIPVDLSNSKSSEQLIPGSLMGRIFCFKNISLKQNILPISESGINCAEDLESLISIGIKGVLIGETFMREADIEQSFKKLFNSI